MFFFERLNRKPLKYATFALACLLSMQMIFGRTTAGIMGEKSYGTDSVTVGEIVREARREQSSGATQAPPLAVPADMPRVTPSEEPLFPEPEMPTADLMPADSLAGDSLVVDSLAADTMPARKPFLNDKITSTNEDSLVYDIRNKTVYIYKDGDVTYEDMNLKADYMRFTMGDKLIYAYGIMDTTKNEATRPIFTQGTGNPYTMDTITYNIDSKKAKIKGVATQEGEGFLKGAIVKKMPDNTTNIARGRYTTCDEDHPHFYIEMTKAKLIPGKKVVMGPAYLVLEDVPLYPLMMPFGFFPIQTSRSSGFIIPSYGEESTKGFFLRDGGYYFAFNDHVDLTLLGGFYTLGSWETSLQSRYLKRYKYSGNLNIKFTKNILGDKGDLDYVNGTNYQITWTHTQDSKFRPNSTFSASVNYSSSGYSKYGSSTVNDYLNTQTNSSIAFSHSWPGTPFSMSANLQHSQNSRDSTISLTLPNIVLNMSKIYPLKRKNAIGKQRWYEKISMSYTGKATNSVTSIPEKDLFTSAMYDEMKNGVQHTIPLSLSTSVLRYLNVSLSSTYNERWYFRKITREWDPVQNSTVYADTTRGFYRLYNYNFSTSLSTTIYGEFTSKNKDAVVKAVRHTMTPSLSMTFTPNFGSDRYGFYRTIQSDSTGNTTTYSPWASEPYGVPGSGKSMSLGFSLGNTIEMKVRSRNDTTGYKKVKAIDQLSFSGSYNFLADSMNLSTIAIQLRASKIYKNFGLNVSATLDPYVYDKQAKTRINRLMIKDGKLGRITSASTSFGYTFNSTNSPSGAMNDINNGGNPAATPITPLESGDFPPPEVSAEVRRQQMSSQYYDFDIPWNLGFSYVLSYSNTGARKNVTQTLSYNGSITLTPKWGLTFSGGYDFESNKITPGTLNITRDLHCWQMSFTWVPTGFIKQWSFNISVKSSVLRDLKYDKRSSMYDSLYE